MSPMEQLQAAVAEYLRHLRSIEPLDDKFKTAKGRVVTAACVLVAEVKRTEPKEPK